MLPTYFVVETHYVIRNNRVYRHGVRVVFTFPGCVINTFVVKINTCNRT